MNQTEVRVWVRSKEICANCPRVTNDTPKPTCSHPWRHDVSVSRNSGQPLRDSDIERMRGLGATFTGDFLDQESRPSIELLAVEPKETEGFIVTRAILDGRKVLNRQEISTLST